MLICSLTQSCPQLAFSSSSAAQKLSGKVRIANVRYSESFRNTSSRESQDFLELFFRMVSG